MRQVAKKMLLPHRAGETVVENVQPIGCPHTTPIIRDCSTGVVISVTVRRDLMHGKSLVDR